MGDNDGVGNIFHQSTMMPLVGKLKPNWQNPFKSNGALFRQERARTTLKRARGDAEKLVASADEARVAGRAALVASLLGRPFGADATAVEAAVEGGNQSDNFAPGGSGSVPASSPSAHEETTGELMGLKQELCSLARKDELTRLVAVLKKIEKVPVDVVMLRQTAIGRDVNCIVKSRGSDSAATLAKKILGRWRKLLHQERDIADSIARKLDQAIWADLVTEEEVPDQLEEYGERTLHVAKILASDPALRRSALKGTPVDEIIEAAAEVPGSDAESDSS